MKTKKLDKLHACNEAVAWASEQKNQQQAWDDCERGDWMLWLIGKLSGEPESKKRKKLVLATCECVRLALPYVAEGELRPLQAIEAAERWARGEADIEEVRSAAAAAYAAADATANTAAAAYAAADAHANVAYAAYAAADAAADAHAAYADAKKEPLKQCADIVRKYYPKVPKF